MQKLLFEVNGITSLGSVDKEEDLKPKGGSNINPKPNEDRCYCCGRPQSELTPFSENIFFGKTKRQIVPHNSIIHDIYMKYFEHCATADGYQKSMDSLVLSYGEIRAKSIVGWIDMGQISSSYECSDCISMDAYEYEERHRDSWDPPERCDCCGKLLGELSPFSEVDPVMGYFTGKLLARRYRPDAPPTEGFKKMMDEFFENCITYEDHKKAQSKLVQIYGLSEAFYLWTFAFFLDHLFQDSWECKDCIGLDTHHYFEKRMAQESGSGQDSSG